jgi:predicted NAD/FAD-dependent oxidoreductase
MENDNAIKVVTLQSTEGYVASYDAVVITIPVPQVRTALENYCVIMS